MRAEPLLVDYPLGGRRLLLHWWTDGDRGHVVIATSERSLLETARRIFVENSDAEIKAACEIVIVAPPERFEKLALECARREAIFDFHFSMCSRVHELVEAGTALPVPFERCARFEPQDEDSAPDSWIRKNHYDCRHCAVGVRVIGMTREEFFDRYSAEWETLHEKDYPGQSKARTRSRASRPESEEGLWYARSNFGHHAGGVELQKIDLESLRSDSDELLTTPDCFTNNLMFFFKRVRELDRTDLEALLAVEKERADRRHEGYEHSRSENFERENRERREDVLRFFEERSPGKK